MLRRRRRPMEDPRRNVPSVGSVRKSGTTVIIEDVAFPIEHLAPRADLMALPATDMKRDHLRPRKAESPLRITQSSRSAVIDSTPASLTM